MLEVIWRPRAHLDRESIALYLGCECRSPRVALETIRRIDAAVERIRTFPDSGGRFAVDGLSHHEYRTAHVNPYTIYYRFDENTLTIHRVLHQRQDIDTFELVNFPMED